jgi:hypothetical protein
MAQVSEEAEELLSQLLAWEMGATELDPKVLLRQVPLADLAVVLSNIDNESFVFQTSATLRLVYLEHLYRTGNLGGDWEVTRDDLTHMTMKIPLKKPIEFITLNLTEAPCS